jgi:hypothetical protein
VNLVAAALECGVENSGRSSGTDSYYRGTALSLVLLVGLWDFTEHHSRSFEHDPNWVGKPVRPQITRSDHVTQESLEESLRFVIAGNDQASRVLTAVRCHSLRSCDAKFENPISPSSRFGLRLSLRPLPMRGCWRTIDRRLLAHPTDPSALRTDAGWGSAGPSGCVQAGRFTRSELDQLRRDHS